MSNNLSVRITADIVDLQTKFAVAKAEVSGLTSEMNKLARASATGVIDSAGTARLQQLSGDLLHARSEMQGYAAAAERAGVSLSGFGRSMESGHGSISTATREFRALFDELSSGRTRQTPGTLAIIAQRVLGLGPAALGAVGGVLALVGGLGYLAYRAIEAKNAIDQMQIGARFAGNMDISRDALKAFADELGQAKGISSSDAREIVGAFASMHDLSAVQIHALSAVVADFAQSTGEKASDAAEKLTKAFSEKESAAEYARSLGGVTQAQINSAEAADKSGDAQAVFAAKFEVLNGALDRSRGAIDQHNQSLTASIKNFLAYYGVVQTANGLEEGQTKLIEDVNAARLKQIHLLGELREEMANQAPSQDQTLKTGVGAAEKENPVALQADEAKSKIAEMSAALSVAKDKGDQVSIDKLNAGLAKAREELSNLQFGPVLERMREQMEQVASTWDGTQSGLLAKQIQIAQATLASVSQNSKESLAVKSEEARLEVEMRKSAGEEIIANARNQISEIQANDKQGTTGKLEAEEQVWREVLAGSQISASQRLEVERSLNADIASVERQRSSEAAAIAREDANTDIAISKIRIETEKQTLDAQVTATRAAAAQKFDTLKNLVNQELALDIEALQNELETLKTQPVEYARVMDQIRELKAKNVQELATLDRQEVEDAKKAAKEQASDWKGAVGEIESAESGMVSDLLTKRKSLSQSLESIGAQLVTKEIANDLKAFTTRTLLYTQGDAAQKAAEQGGFLYHLLTSNQETAATVQSQAAQTSAVNAGNAARTASTLSAATASKGAGAAAGGQTVMADAAKAFSGTYASVSQIPYVGWILAPAAAAAAFAAVAAYEGLASLDVGTNLIPQDMLAVLHAGEAVVPKAFNPAANGGSSAGAGGGLGGVTHNYGNISMTDTSLRRMLSSRSNQRAAMDAMAGAYRRGARPR